jgi:hypothetical protein
MREQATAKAKCGGLSAAAAKNAAFGRDDGSLVGAEENRQRQRQQQIPLLRCGMTNKKQATATAL